MKYFLVVFFILLINGTLFSFNDSVQFFFNYAKDYIGDAIDNGIADTKCGSDLKAFLADLSEMKSWALKMFDANSKIPVGLSSGNIFQFGDYDLCLAINETLKGISFIQGKYCTTFIAQETNSTKDPLELIKTNNILLPSIDKFGSFGICIPKSCSIANLKDMWKYIKTWHELPLELNMLEHLCVYKDKEIISYSADVYINWFLGIILVITLIGTMHDIYYFENSTKYSALLTFSLMKNAKKLFAKETQSELTFLNAIRVFFTTWIVFGHFMSVQSFTPQFNTLYTAEWLQTSGLLLMGALHFSVDSFFTITGFLISYNYLNGSERHNITIFQFYSRRMIRMFPLLLANVLFRISVFKYLSDGPFWHVIVDNISTSCATNWWQTLTFLTNWNTNSQCIGETWYSSVDMQLFLLSPLVLFFIKKHTFAVMFGIIVMTLISFLYTFCTVVMHDFVPINLLFSENFNWYIYFSVFAKMPVWFIGVVFGYILYRYKPSLHKTSNSMRNIIWIISISVLLVQHFASPLVLYLDAGYLSAAYLTFSKPLWSLALCGIIFVHFIENLTNKPGWFNKFASAQIFSVLNRLGYGIYLVHFTTIIFLKGNQKKPNYFSGITMLQDFLGCMVIVLGVSLGMNLLFESPFLGLKNYAAPTKLGKLSKNKNN